jgi:hypothetical protein
MLIKRTFVKNLVFEDPIKIAEDPDTHIVNALHETFVGKYLNGCIITKILKINNSNEPMLFISNIIPDGSAGMDIEFDAEAITFERDEIITGCTITATKNDNWIHLTHPYAYIAIQLEKRLMSLTVGQIVPCRVLITDSQPNRDKINIIASLNIRFDPPVIYTCNADFSLKNNNDKSIKDILEHISEVTNMLESYNKTRIELFSDILYPIGIKLIKANALNIDKNLVLKKNTNYTNIISEATLIETKDESVGTHNPADLVYKFLSIHYRFLQTIYEMCQMYPEDKKADENLFKIFNEKRETV